MNDPTEIVNYGLWCRVWELLGLENPPSRPGPCWCNYGMDGDGEDNTPSDDFHHHLFCRERRIRLRRLEREKQATGKGVL